MYLSLYLYLCQRVYLFMIGCGRMYSHGSRIEQTVLVFDVESRLFCAKRLRPMLSLHVVGLLRQLFSLVPG